MQNPVYKDTFKKVLRGYSPEDVNEYILKLSDDYKASKEQLQEAVTRLTDDKERLLKENERLKAELEEIKSNFEEKLAVSEENATKKAEQYDRLSSTIGDVMLSVSNRTRSITEKTQNAIKESVENAFTNTVKSTDDAKANLERDAKTLSDSIKNSIDELTKKYLENFSNTIDSIRKNTEITENILKEDKNSIISDSAGEFESIKAETEQEMKNAVKDL